MKPENFPERKNERRQSALARFERMNPGRISSVALAWEHYILGHRIVEDARGVRTKIRRGPVSQGRKAA